MKEIMSIKEVAEYFGHHTETVYDWCRTGRISHASKVGGRWVINAAAEWPQLFSWSKEAKDAENVATAK